MRVQVPPVLGKFLPEATSVTCPNQFVLEACLNGVFIQAHMADRGHLRDLLYPGAHLVLALRSRTKRQTFFQAVYADEELVSLDTQLPPFTAYTTIQSEKLVDGHRFDFCLGSEHIVPCLLGVKSASLVINHIAPFPDAPTERGRHYIEMLADLAKQE